MDEEIIQISKDTGLVTAYGYAKAGGYTGTEEEFKEALAVNVEAVESSAASASAAASSARQAAAFVGSPLQAATAAGMTDTNKIYVYTGSESGYNNGHWYYYNGSAWADGGTYENLSSMINSLAANYDPTKTYALGAYCIQNNALYRCTTAIETAEEWTANHWTQVKLGDDVSDLRSALSDFDPLYSTLMEQGSLSAVNVGQPLRPGDSSVTIRTVDFSPWEPGMSVHLKDGFEARLLLCDADGNYIVDVPWTQNPTSSRTADLVKVLVKRTGGTSITPDDIIQAIISTDIPLTIVYPKANESDFTDFKDKIEAVTADLIESNAYYLENVTPARSSGILDRWNNPVSTGEHYSIPVAYGERYWLLGYKWGSDYAGYYLRKNGAIVSYDNTTPTSTMRNWDVTIPDGVDELYLNSNYSFGAIYKKVSCCAKPNSKWTGKKIVWFGTSIPEKSTYNAVIGYPEYVGTLLGATVYNEAVGSSCARRGFKTAESLDDPYGWTGMGVAALWNMGSTVEEKNEIITNWESKWRNLTGYNVDMTDAISAKAIACSYENKLVQKYIVDNPVDLYVFDHGYNDWKTGDLDMDANDPFDRSTFQGAMNTYIKLILEAKPRARIVIISHYEDQERAGLIEMQKGEAEYWNLPFCKIYEKLGWANNRQITTTGYWSSNGVWIESSETTQTLSLKQYHMPDGRHPNTDRTGRACMDIANVIADYIDSIAPAN